MASLIRQEQIVELKLKGSQITGSTLPISAISGHTNIVTFPDLSDYLPLTGGTLTGDLNMVSSFATLMVTNTFTSGFTAISGDGIGTKSLGLKSQDDTNGSFLTGTFSSNWNVTMPNKGGTIAFLSDLTGITSGSYLPLSGGTLTNLLSGTTIGLSGDITANSFIKIGGTSSQYLMADGTVSTGSTSGSWTINTDQSGLTGDKSTTGSLEINYPSNSSHALRVSNVGTTTPTFIADNTANTGIGAIQEWRHNGQLRSSMSKSGDLLSNSFIKSGGTSSQFLKADGSVDSNTYLTTIPPLNYLSLTGGTLTGTLTANSFIKSGGTSSQYLMADGSVSTGYNLSMGIIDSVPNASGATISGNTLYLQPANTSFGGITTTGAQTFAGAKRFTSNLTVSRSPDAAFIVDNSSGKAAALIAGALKSSFVFDNTGTFSIQTQTKTLILSGTPSGTPLAEVQAAGHFGIAGNMSIGTISTSPNFNLEFTNGAGKSIGITNSSNTVVGQILTIGAGSTQGGGSNNLAGGTLQLLAGIGVGTGTSNIEFRTSQTLSSGNSVQTRSTRMILNGNGNLGINHTSPTEKLYVSGNTIVTGTGLYGNNITISGTSTPNLILDGSSNSQIKFKTSGANKWDIYTSGNGLVNYGYSGTDWYVYTNETQALVISSGQTATFSGNVTANNISGGTYTPTTTHISGITATVPHICQFIRIGNIVTVHGSVNIQSNGAGTGLMRMSLPIPSNFTSVENLNGLMVSKPNNFLGSLTADTTNDEISAFFDQTSVSQLYTFSFSYEILV